MKNHKRFEELIQGYVDNALSNKERLDLENHLKSCKMCEEKLKAKEKLLQKLRSTKEEIQCPDYVIDNILKNTTQKETPAIIRSYKIRWRYLAVSAAAVLIVVSTVLLNIEDSKKIFTTKGSEEIQKKEAVDEVEILKSKDTSLDKKEVEKEEEKKLTMKSISKEPDAPKISSPEKKKDFAASEKPSDITSSEDIREFTASEEAYEKMPMLSKAPKALPSAAIKSDRSGESLTFEPETGIEIGEIPPAIPGGIPAFMAISEENFKETRFVFPEEGSVVGKDFEIVLILENPEEKIEITLDGEKIVNYTREKDSNVIFIGSDSIPPLEEGLHYLSLSTKEEKSITFYKEG
jgi:hypothetical protein